MATQTDTAAVTYAEPKVGLELTFKQYAELGDGQDPIFQPDEAIRISKVDTDDEGGVTLTITSLDGSKVDSAFLDEVNLPEVTAKPAGKAKPAAKGKAQPTAKPAAEAAPAAAAPTVKGGAAAAKKEAAAKKKADADKAKADAKAKKDAEKAAKAAKAPKVATPQPKVEPEKVEIVRTDTLESILEGTDAMSAAKSLIDQTEETFFTLGGVLSEIYHNELYKTAGYDGKQGWQTYLLKELNLQYRKGQYLMDIYTAFTALDIDEKRLSSVGWSKARELARVVNAENLEELLDFADNHTKDEIIEHIKVNYPTARAGSGTGNAQPTERTKKTTYKFSLFEQNAVIANAALEAGKSRFDTPSMDDAFFGILSEWAQLSGATETTLEDELARINTKFGINIDAEYAAGTAGDGGGE